MSDPVTPLPVPVSRPDQQGRDLRFLETLQTTLAGCSTESSIYSSAVHRVAAVFAADAVCLAAYEPVANTIDIVHQAGTRQRWDTSLFRQSLAQERLTYQDGTLVVPILCGDGPWNERQVGGRRRPWGLLAVARSAEPSYSPAERHTLRATAERIGVELERRHAALLDDVLDSLLRKTKPIDVYTHTLRELRRFIRYDHSASIMTMQRGMAQITVRVEKVVRARGRTVTLSDSPRRGRVLHLTAGQSHYLAELEGPLELQRMDGEAPAPTAGWNAVTYADGGHHHPELAGLSRVLCLNHGSGEAAVLCYPLVFGGHMLGILRLGATQPHAFEPLDRHVRVLDRFARLLAVTLYRSELYHQSDRQLQAIKEIGRAITEPMTVEDICRRVLELALRVLHVQVGVVGLLQHDGTLELVAHQGCTLAEPPDLTVGQGISGTVVQTGRSWAVPDVTREPAYLLFNGRVRSELVAPITYDQEVIGFLDVESFEEGRFREEDEEVITFLEALANQVAIGIKTAQLREEAVTHLGAAMSIDPTLSTAGLQDLLIQQLRAKLDQLAAANQAKSDFLARMSHDLRGPLNVIVGLANLLTDPAVAPSLTTAKQHESLDVIRSSGEVLSSLIGKVLDLSALEAGKVELRREPIPVQAALNYLRSMAGTLAEDLGRTLEITVAADPNLGTITVDEEKFLRIMINLISNALSFTASGGRVTVTADVVSPPEPDLRAQGGLALHLAVADTGIGIPAEYHEMIFQPFARVERGAQHHGTGLGLAVVRQLTELHGGRVWVESAPGAGSTFHVVLPHALASDDAAHAPGTFPPQAAAGAPRQSKGMVLVVEDTEAHMNLMRLAVTSRGYTMHGVTSGEEALAWLADHRPDVILLDLQLPGMDGFTVAARIKGQVETQSIPTVAVTADAFAATEQRALASGCDAYLTKPLDLAALLTTIDDVASRLH